MRHSTTLTRLNFCVQEYLDVHSGTLAYLKQATTLPDCYFEKEYSSPNPGMLMPELTKFRASSRILAIEALSCAARGDVSTALHNITTIQRLAQHQAQSPILISMLVAMAIDSIAKQTLERVLNSTQPRPCDFDASPVWVSTSYRRNFRRAMVEEQASMLNMMADVADGKKPLYHDFEVPYRDSLFAPFYRVFQAKTDVQRNRETFIGIKGLIADNGLIPIDMKNDMDKDYYYSVSSFAHASIGAARTDASNNLVTLALAMAKYRAQNGAYPEKLDALVPTFLPSIPLDPFDREPLKMTRKGDELWLYSVGDEKKPLPEKYTPTNSYYNSEFVRIFRLKAPAPAAAK